MPAVGTDLVIVERSGVLYKATAAQIAALASGGGSDPWTKIKLASDYTNATATFADITDGTTTLTWTPPANTEWQLEAGLVLVTPTAANLPRIGVSVPANGTRGWGAINMAQQGANGTAQAFAHGGWADGSGAANIQFAVGGLPNANVPALLVLFGQGISGATPTAITLQMACETAGAGLLVKKSSFLRYRTV